MITLCCLILAVGNGFAQSLTLTGQQIVTKMADRYATARTYQDIGISRKVAADGSTAVSEEPAVYFRTYFDRPNRFRFEWEDQLTSKSWGILWSDGDNVFVKWANRQMEKQRSLEAGIAGASPFLLSAARDVPNLLMRDLGGFRLTQIQRVTRLRDAKVGDDLCFVVRGYHPYGFQVDLWIGKSDFLLRRKLEKNDDGTFDEEVRSYIQLNSIIPARKFQFDSIQKGELVAKL